MIGDPFAGPADEIGMGLATIGVIALVVAVLRANPDGKVLPGTVYAAFVGMLLGFGMLFAELLDLWTYMGASPS